MRRLSICLILSVWTSLLIAQFTDMSASLTGVLQSSVAWGDYDNDGDLDIALCGWTGSERISKVYRNDGGTFVDLSASLIGVNAGSVAWGDFDNDGDLDLVLMGFNPSEGGICKIYRNDAGTFVEHPSSLRGSELGATAWGDYDNDGDLDLLITGLGQSTIYRNDEGSFLDITAGLTGVSNSSAAWGDYDNDGDLDILLTGLVNISNFVTKVYRNDGGGVFVDIGAPLVGVSVIGGSSISRSAEWGDYDNDGDLDILVTGRTVANELVARVYRNGAGSFSDIGAGIIGISESSVAWGDYDNDGDLDIALCGWTGSESISKIYRNDNGTFVVDISAILIGVNIGSVAWGDYDNDGDLDILLTGGGGATGFIAKIFRNEISKSNTSPTSPSGLISSSSMNSVTLQWNKSTDLETPQNGLTYNLRMGKTPGGSEIVSPMANVSTGYRRIPKLGNTNHRNSSTINNLSPGTYYWSAQAIDNAFAGSAFATEQSFTVTIYTVWNEANDGAGSLRQAIQDANTHPGLDFIVFNIPGPGPHTILPTSPLPSITDPVIVDGTTDPDFGGTPIIQLNGSGLGGGASGLIIQASGCTVRGLVVNRFSTGYGILISGPGATGNTISGNYIGIDPTGQLAQPNKRGIQIENASGNTIGGLTAAERNVVSGGHEIAINIISGSNNNTVVGNSVGTNFNGTSPIPNNNGIWIQNSSDNTVGGSAAGARNIVSGNDGNGIWIDLSGTGNSVKGNYVGLASDGDTPLGNKHFGIKISGSAGNIIGGPNPGDGNVVSANGSLSPPRHGIYIEYENSGIGNVVQGNLVGTDATGMVGRGNVNFGICVLEATHNKIINNVVADNRYGVVLWGADAGAGANYNLVQGNLIGTKANGTERLGNELGLYIRNGHHNIVGGTSSGARNIISGNRFYGLAIGRVQSSENLVQGNYIGLDINGSTTPLGNGYEHPTQQGFGIDIFDATRNIIGGIDPGAGNVISGNFGNGILIDKDTETTTENVVQGNFIGTDPTGMTAVGNTFGVTIKDASGNLIGGVTTGNRNIISGNTDDGINILGSSGTGNIVAGNYIGIGSDGDTPLGNGDDGINVGSAENTIGAGNVFSANGSHGIVIVGSSATGNRVMGNYVGTDAAGTTDRGNGEGGIFVGNGASGNIIGGTTQEERNIISANGVNPPPDFPSGIHGVVITGFGTAGNVVIGNHIGTDVSGATALGNGGDGIQIRNGASANRIGATNPGERNVISGNDVTGVAIFGSGTTNNSVQGNYIGLDATGTGNVGHPRGTGVYIGAAAANNTVGGTAPAERNFISGNIGWAGVVIDGANNNTIVGNSIGTDINGTASFGNLVGVRIYNGASGNKIGGTAVGEGNLIVHSIQQGVLIDGSGTIRNSILSNSIHLNGELGIDLGGEGVTPNDPGDTDDGANNLQNFPELKSARYHRGNTIVEGSLNSTPNTSFLIQFFGNPAYDPSDHREGERLIGSRSVTTDGAGRADFNESLPFGVTPGFYVTATTTDPSQNTSEFSQCVVLTPSETVVENFPLHYKINDRGEPTITDGSDFQAVRNAFQHWQDVSTSTVSFLDDGLTDERNASATDGINLVTFSDEEFLFPPGVLAVAAKTIDLSAGESMARIVDADIVFNPYWTSHSKYNFGTDTKSGTFDIESITAHEVGHLLGLVHSGVLDATMFFILQTGKEARTLEHDDVAWVSHLYPEPAFSTSFGSIEGTVGYGYEPNKLVAGALLMATNVLTNVSVHAYSDENGDYLIPGLPAGDYKISLQPLDGDVEGFPFTPAHVSAYILTITKITDYPKEFYNNSDEAIEDPDAFSLVTVSAGATLSDIDFTTNRDTTPPEIIAVFPANGATEVDLLTEVIVTFSEPIDVNTVNTETIKLGNESGSTQGTFLFLKGNQVAVFTPQDPLSPSTSYVLTVTGVTDARGNPLSASFSSSFTTKSTDVVPPTVTQVVPEIGATDVFVTSKVVVIFSEPILSSSLTASSFTVSSGGVPVDGTITLTQEHTVATFTPVQLLSEGAGYEIKVTTDVQDLFRNPLATEFSSTFRTVAQAPPAVVFVGPADNATGISVTTPVLADFSEPIARSSITANSFVLSLDGAPVQGTFDFLNDDSRVVFRPSENLEFNSQYQLRITTAVEDKSGASLQNEFTRSFTTASAVLQPTISSIDPPAAVIGTVVVIAGEGFDPDPTKNVVSFNGVLAVVTNASLTSVTAKVPQDATSGPVTVTVRGVPSNSHNFDVLRTIDDPKNVVVASVDMESEPRDADVTPDGTLAYVTNAGANSVSVIDLNVLAPAVIASIQVGNAPLKIVINPQGTLAYVTNFLSNTVSVIDIKPGSPTRHQVIAAIPVEINPIGVVVTPDGHRVYVANFTSKSVSVIDADPKSGAFHHVIAKVDLDSEPRDVDVSPDGTLAFVAAKSGLIIINIDPSASAFNSVVANVDTDSEARDIEVTPDGTLAIVVTANGAILIIDIFPRSPGFGQVVASVDSDSGPREAEVTPDGTLVYITNFKTNDVSVFEFVYSQGVIGGVSPITTAGVRLKFLETIPVGKAPEGIVIDHLARRAVVVNSGSNDVTIIGITSDDVAVTLLIEQIQNLIDNPSTPAAALGNLRKAKQNLEQAIKRLSEGKTLQFFDELNQAVHDLLKAARDGAIVSDIINLIVKTARRLAQDALNAAIGFAGKKNVDEQIDKAKKEMAAADQAVAAGDFENAIAHFRLAWDAAQRAIQLALKGSGFNQEQADATVKETVPTEFALNQNYPNPFNSTTQVSFDIPLRAENGIHVELKVYNLLGQLVNTLVNEIRAPGSYTVLWRGNHYDGRAAASGLYILHIRAGEFRAARKMILLQ